MSLECNLRENRIGKITIKSKDLFKFKVILNKITEKYEVIGDDGWIWAEATNATGAVNGALACGVPLKDISYNGNYVSFKDLNI